MSKIDLVWTEEHAAAAKAEGWRLMTTLENTKGAKPEYEIASTMDNTNSDQAMTKLVIERAHQYGSAGELHRLALRMTMKG